MFWLLGKKMYFRVGWVFPDTFSYRTRDNKVVVFSTVKNSYFRDKSEKGLSFRGPRSSRSRGLEIWGREKTPFARVAKVTFCSSKEKTKFDQKGSSSTQNLVETQRKKQALPQKIFRSRAGKFETFLCNCRIENSMKRFTFWLGRTKKQIMWMWMQNHASK